MWCKFIPRGWHGGRGRSSIYISESQIFVVKFKWERPCCDLVLVSVNRLDYPNNLWDTLGTHHGIHGRTTLLIYLEKQILTLVR